MKTFQQEIEEFKRDYKKFLDEMKKIAIEDLKSSTDFGGSMSGPLRNSYEITDIDSGFVFTSNAKSPKGTSYASFVEFGRGEVRPVNVEWLTFQIDGRWIRTKYCGLSKATHYMDNISKDLDSKASSVAEKVFK